MRIQTLIQANASNFDEKARDNTCNDVLYNQYHRGQCSNQIEVEGEEGRRWTSSLSRHDRRFRQRPFLDDKIRRTISHYRVAAFTWP